MRYILFGVPRFEDLGLPDVIGTLAREERGIILVTGTTGSGKSTTLASMLNLVNRSAAKHIVTIEDSIEFLHRNDKSIINQREVGADTASYTRALRRVLRQDLDIISVRSATQKARRSRCQRRRPGISCSARCTRWTRPRRSTA